MPIIIAAIVGFGSFTGYVANDKEIPQHAYLATKQYIQTQFAEAAEWKALQGRMDADDKALDLLSK